MSHRLLLHTLPVLALSLSAAATSLTITIENLSPMDGTWTTPFWVGIHDGTFDVFDGGAPASMSVERFAEDGNSGPLMADFSGSGSGQLQATLVSDSGIPPLAPGETATMVVDVDGDTPSGQYLSFFAMILPSNDAFVGNEDPMAHRVFNGAGQFQPLELMLQGGAIMDAGTELNDELPAHTAFFGQNSPDTGVSESMPIGMHAGYLPAGSGGILDDPMFAAADFTQSAYPLLRIRVARTAVSATEDIPANFSLAPAWPNPFNPSTTLAFSLAETAPVRLAVYNLAGQQVALLQDGLLSGGEHRVVFDATGLASGMYLASLNSGGQVQTQRLVLIK
ncbi:MAG: spondin domain-containing protein [Candidatus Delongbacteria bacterium]|nr:spondin domain-containing protein [Candidatus Cloacimonadota bacterium]MCB9473893.1 spondin domain-containing protein [Candidatus Delongbacteria bacterium]